MCGSLWLSLVAGLAVANLSVLALRHPIAFDGERPGVYCRGKLASHRQLVGVP